MTLEEQRAYSRGYNTGCKGSWPLHRPPRPPDEQVGALVDALQKLRNGVDGFIATLCNDDDEITLDLGPLVDQADEALASLGEWIVQTE